MLSSPCMYVRWILSLWRLGLAWRCQLACKAWQQVDCVAAGTLLAVQLLLMGWVESKRWVDFFKPKSQGEKGSFLGFESVLAGSGTPGCAAHALTLWCPGPWREPAALHDIYSSLCSASIAASCLKARLAHQGCIMC